MMDIDTIVALNKEAGNKAKRHGIKPTTFEEKTLDVDDLKEIEHLGNYVPKGWKRFDVNKYVMKWELPYSHKILDLLYFLTIYSYLILSLGDFHLRNFL